MRTNIDRLLMHIAIQSTKHTIQAYPFFNNVDAPAEDVWDRLAGSCFTPQTVMLSDVKSPAIKAVQIWRKCIKKKVRDYTEAFDVLCELSNRPDKEKIAGKIITEVFGGDIYVVPVYFVHGHPYHADKGDGAVYTNLQEAVLKIDIPTVKAIVKDLDFDLFMAYLCCLGENGRRLLVDCMNMKEESFDRFGTMGMTSCISVLRKYLDAFQTYMTSGAEEAPTGVFRSQEGLDTNYLDPEISGLETKPLSLNDKNERYSSWLASSEQSQKCFQGTPAFVMTEQERIDLFQELYEYVWDFNVLDKLYKFIKEGESDYKLIYSLNDSSTSKLFAMVLALYASTEDLKRMGRPVPAGGYTGHLAPLVVEQLITIHTKQMVAEQNQPTNPNHEEGITKMNRKEFDIWTANCETRVTNEPWKLAFESTQQDKNYLREMIWELSPMHDTLTTMFSFIKGKPVPPEFIVSLNGDERLFKILSGVMGLYATYGDLARWAVFRTTTFSIDELTEVTSNLVERQVALMQFQKGYKTEHVSTESLAHQEPLSETAVNFVEWYRNNFIAGTKAFGLTQEELENIKNTIKNSGIDLPTLDWMRDLIIGKPNKNVPVITQDVITVFGSMLVLLANREHLQAFGIPCTESYNIKGAVQVAKTILSRVPRVGTNEEINSQSLNVKHQDTANKNAINFIEWCRKQYATGPRVFTLTFAEYDANCKCIKESDTPIETLDWMFKVITTGKNPTWPHFPVVLNIDVFASMLRLVATRYSMITFRIPCIKDYNPEEADKLSRIILAKVRECPPAERYSSDAEALQQSQEVEQMKLTAEQCADLGLHLMTVHPELFTQLCKEISEKKIARQSLTDAMGVLADNASKVKVDGPSTISNVISELEALLKNYDAKDIILELSKQNPALRGVVRQKRKYIIRHYLGLISKAMSPVCNNQSIGFDIIIDAIKSASFNCAAPTGEVFHTVTDPIHIPFDFDVPEYVAAGLGRPVMNPNPQCSHCGQIHANYGRSIFINLDGKK